MASRTNLQAWVKLASAADTEWTAYTVDASGEIDLTGLTAGETYDISVPPEYLVRQFVADSAPSVSISALDATYGASVTINPTYGGTNRTYSLSGPSWLAINAGTGQITGTAPSSDVSSSYTVTVSNAAGSASATADVTVGEVPGNTFESTITAYTGDDLVFDSGAAFARSAAVLPVAGTTDATDGIAIEARTIYATDNVQHSAWAEVGTAASGVYSGTMTVPKPTGARAGSWLLREVRVAGSAATPARDTKRVGVGHVVGIMGQSEMSRALTNGGGGSGYAGTLVDDQFQIVRGTETFVGGEPGGDVTDFTTSRLSATDATSDATIIFHAADALGKNTADLFMWIDMATSGTSRGQLADDTNDRRRWEDTVEVLDAAGWQDGVRPGLILDSWHNADTALIGFTDWLRVLKPLYTGKDASGATMATGGTVTFTDAGSSSGDVTYRYDHFLFDLSGEGRGLFDPTETKVAFAWHRYDPYDVDLTNWIIRSDDASIARSAWMRDRVVEEGRAELLADADMAQVAALGWDMMAYENGSESVPGVNWNDAIHPGNDIDGLQIYARQLAMATMAALGIVDDPQPEFDVVTYDASGNFADFAWSGGPVTTTRKLRGLSALGATFDHWTDVLGFEFNDQPVSRAEIVDDAGDPADAGKVRVYVPTASAPADWSKSRFFFARTGGGGLLREDEDSQNGAWQNYPVVAQSAVGLSGMADDTRGTTGTVGVPLRATNRSTALAPAAYRSAAVAMPAGGMFRDPAAVTAMTGALGNQAVRWQAEVAIWDAMRGWNLMGQDNRNSFIINRNLQTSITNFQGSNLFTSAFGAITPGVRHKIVWEIDFTAGTSQAWIDGVEIYNVDDVTGTFGGGAQRLHFAAGPTTTPSALEMLPSRWELVDLAVFAGTGAATGNPATEPDDARRWFRVRASDGAAAIAAAQSRTPAGAWWSGPALT